MDFVFMLPNFGAFYIKVSTSILQLKPTNYADVIVTCASLLVSDLCGESIKIINRRASDLEPPNTTPGMLYLKVRDEKDLQWYLPLDKCQTWFLSSEHVHYHGIARSNHVVITALFAEHTTDFAQDFEIRIQGHTMKPEDWPKVYSQAHKTSLRLDLKRR
jgi:hypothetical protein